MKEKKPRAFNRVNRKELRQQLAESAEKRATLSFYKYHRIAEPSLFRDDFYLKMHEIEVFGRVYVSSEGINGQISVPESKLESFKKRLESWDWLAGLRLNFAREDDGKSFFLLDVKVRKKIVADGIDDPDFDPERTGQHLSARAFNALTERPETIVVDMRNHYETEVGHFAGAICPPNETFRESLPMVVELLEDKKNRPVVMYCTGGIRCEKASAWLKFNGFENVFQLEGGIIEYDRQAKAEGLENKFVGKNFVFDERRGERIGPEIIARCHQCGAACDDHQNCANDHCHLLFIQCATCAERFSKCCSALCQNFSTKAKADQKIEAKNFVFNAARFGPSGHYRAPKNGELLA